jgi:2-alkenal reductase
MPGSTPLDDSDIPAPQAPPGARSPAPAPEVGNPPNDWPPPPQHPWSAPAYSPPPRSGPLPLRLVAILILIAAVAGGGAGYVAGSTSHPVVSGLVSSGSGAGRTSQVSVAESLAMIEAAKKVGPAVVTITTTGTASNPLGPNQTFQALGSGVIVDTAGDILTNNHVVQNGTDFTVLFAQATKSTPAKLVGKDPLTDLAVLKVSEKVPAIAQFGVSKDLQPGEQVMAIGSALGDYRNTVTAGVISAVHRQLVGTEMDDMLQTDASINHGNSGGPLINLSGEVVGINTAIAAGDPGSGDVARGIGFAIPSDRARDISLQLIQHGGVVHPYLGVEYQSIDSQLQAAGGLASDHGALVRKVTAGSPADHGGVKPGDIILAVNGEEINIDNTLFSRLSAHHVGDKIQLTILRGTNTRQSLDVTLGQRPAGL